MRAGRLAEAARYVARTIRDNYPDLDVPYHSRWRHFGAGGVDRWRRLEASWGSVCEAERARLRFELAVVSVLLDAGAGAAWRYVEPHTGHRLARSEGLAVASLHLFASGALCRDGKHPAPVDAGVLTRLDRPALMRAFQVSPSNPLVGVDGRVALLNALGHRLLACPELFGESPPRPGNLYDYLAARAVRGALPAREILVAVLRGFAPIWPGRLRLGGVPLGDVWRHAKIRRAGPTDGLVPLHKLSQWLTYSLVEPLQEAGIRVTGLDDLTGLAEYRNGGLLVDLGVLRPRSRAARRRVHDVASELVVEWRALTVALLDELAPLVRRELGLDARALPLAKLLQGGTWSAGRRIAGARRGAGGPPIRVASDGTVF